MARKLRLYDQQRLRNLAWEIGQCYPRMPAGDWCVLLMVHPRLAHVFWSVQPKAPAVVAEGCPSLRLCDVTDIIYNGTNAHCTIDIPVENYQGSRNIPLDQPSRNYLAEFGLMHTDGTFQCLVRSSVVWFERDRPSGTYRTDGLLVNPQTGQPIPIENIFDAPVFERMHREARVERLSEPIRVAVIRIGIGTLTDDPLGDLLHTLVNRQKKFGVHARLFKQHLPDIADLADDEVAQMLHAVGKTIATAVKKDHTSKPFHLLHCHDWTAATAVGALAAELNIPLVLTLHSTEHERSAGMQHRLSPYIYTMEAWAAHTADLTIVPHSSSRQQVTALYGLLPERVVIIPDISPSPASSAPEVAEDVRRVFALPADAELVLFAGELSHAAGADILVDALLYICRVDRRPYFIFAGDGPLRNELEHRTTHDGAGHRCRFLGNLSPHYFDAVLALSTLVVIPARTWQDEGLAQLALSAGKPVLATHQAGIGCIVHGENGLLTYDNPNSIIWGIQELLNHPLHNQMMRAAARAGSRKPSLDALAAQHYTSYSMVMHGTRR